MEGPVSNASPDFTDQSNNSPSAEEILWGWRMFCTLAFSMAVNLLTSERSSHSDGRFFGIAMVVIWGSMLFNMFRSKDYPASFLLILFLSIFTLSIFPYAPHPVLVNSVAVIVIITTTFLFRRARSAQFAIKPLAGKIVIVGLLLAIVIQPIVRVLLEPDEPRSLFEDRF